MELRWLLENYVRRQEGGAKNGFIVQPLIMGVCNENLSPVRFVVNISLLNLGILISELIGFKVENHGFYIVITFLPPLGQVL